MNSRPDDYLISFVLPLFNERSAIVMLVDQIHHAIEPMGCRYEMVFVNDGSTDGSEQILDLLASSDSRIRVLHLSRNFGHQPALQAGLEHAYGDAVVVMDSDLQDDPRSVPAMIAKWREGFDVVFAVRKKRKEGPIKRAMFFCFYRLLNMVSRSPIPNDAGNFGLIDRRVSETVRSIPDADRFYSGLRHWVGYRQTGITVERLARHDDQPRVSWYQLFQLAKSALFSFSRAPLSLFYAISVLSLIVCGACFTFTLYHKIMTDLAIPGWASNIMAASFFGALNALGIGVLGEYVVRIYDQVRNRPPFIVSEIRNASSSQENSSRGFEPQDVATNRSAPNDTAQKLTGDIEWVGAAVDQIQQL